MTDSEPAGSPQTTATSNESLTGSGWLEVPAVAVSIAAVAKAGAGVARTAIEQRGLTRRAEINAETTRGEAGNLLGYEAAPAPLMRASSG
jgi:2-keto-3-deoxy-galactonokinase